MLVTFPCLDIRLFFTTCLFFQQTAELIDLKPDPCSSTSNLASAANAASNSSKPAVSFHTILDAPPGALERRAAEYKQSRRSGNWKNIFSIPAVKQNAPQLLRSIQPLGGRSSHRDLLRASQKEMLRSSHREINIDEAMLLPENKPINYRPRPKSELNLSYSVQVRLFPPIL